LTISRSAAFHGQQIRNAAQDEPVRFQRDQIWSTSCSQKKKKKDLEHQLELKAPNPSKDYYSELSTFNMLFLRFLLQEQYGDSVGTNVMTIYSLKKVYMR
jgi:hypothetical protein